MTAVDADLEHCEGMGALNFLALDDLSIDQEGGVIHSDSILARPVHVDLPALPQGVPDKDGPFLLAVEASDKKWVILTDPEENPLLVFDADAYLRAVLFAKSNNLNPHQFCFRPLIIRDGATHLGRCLKHLSMQPAHQNDDVIDRDLILLWNDQSRRILTGADILGRLLRGIVPVEKTHTT